MLNKLVKKAQEKNARFKIRYNPEEEECWGIKYYPFQNLDDHYWSYGKDFENTVQKLLSEIEGF